ncbi:MAG: hypothetical protein QXX12_01110 [Nanopusillaceae archaeon]
MPQYDLGVSEEQPAQDNAIWAVGKQVVFDMDYNDTMDWPPSERFSFELEPANLYSVSVVWV